MWTQIALLTCSFLVLSNGVEARFGGLNIDGAFISKSKFCEYQCRIIEDSVTCGPECDVGQSRAAAEAFIDDEFGVVCINQNCTIFMGKKAINAALNREEMGKVRDIFVFYNNRSINEFRKGVNDAFERFQNLKQRVIPTLAPLTNGAIAAVGGGAQNKDTTTEKINTQLLSESPNDGKSRSKPLKNENNKSGSKPDVRGGNSPPLNEGIEKKTAINGNSPPLNEGIEKKTAISGNETVLNQNSDSGQDNVSSINARPMDDKKKYLSTINDTSTMTLKIDKIQPKSGIIGETEDSNNDTLSPKNENSVNARIGGIDEIGSNNQNLNNVKINEGGNAVPGGILAQTLNNEGSNGGQGGIMDLNNIINKTINKQNNASVSSVSVSKNTNGVKTVSNLVMYGNKTLHNKTQTIEDGNENSTALNEIIDGDKMLNNQIGNDISNQNRTIVGIKTITTTSHVIMYGNEAPQNKTEMIEGGNSKGLLEENGVGNKEDANNLKNVAGNEKKTTLHNGADDNRENNEKMSNDLQGNDVRNQNQTNVGINKMKTTNKENINGGSADGSRNDLKNVVGNENGPALPKGMNSENKNQGEKLNQNNEALDKFKGTNDKNIKNKSDGNQEGRNGLKSASGNKNQGEKVNLNNKAMDNIKGTNNNNENKNNLKTVAANGFGTTVPNKMNSENKFQDKKLNLNNQSPTKQKNKPEDIGDNENEKGGKPNANLNKEIKITINKSKDGAEKQNKESDSLENNFGEDNYQDGSAKNAKNQVTPKNGILKADAANLGRKNKNLTVRSGSVDKVVDKEQLENKYKRKRAIENVKNVNYKKRNFFLSKIYEIIY